MKIQYEEKLLRPATLAVVEQANEIIDEYLKQGFRLTLRQLYYQFVARDLIANKLTEYKRLGSIVSDGRRCGLMDWSAIEDRTRNLLELPHWMSPEDIVGACARQFSVDKWSDQDYRVEVWVEKEALAGVFQHVCNEHDIALFPCRGYPSDSEVWAAAQRFQSYESDGINSLDQKVCILHFGDHDPSGIDMTRDIRDRLELFGATVLVQRCALNADQVEQYGPPPNPAKDHRQPIQELHAPVWRIIVGA